MQKDRIEQFIENNRAAFDREIPDLEVWANIDQQLEGKRIRKLRIYTIRRVAAALLVLAVAGAILRPYLITSPNVLAEQTTELDYFSPEQVEIFQFYTEEVDDKFQQLVNHEAAQNVLPDLEQIDETMEELKLELAEAPKGKEEQIIENLIKSYQTKLLILERVLERIQSRDSKLSKPERDEISI